MVKRCLSLFCLLSIWSWSCCAAATAPDINASSQLLESGDIVVRMGKGLWSDYFAGISKHEKLYSHSGIIVKINSALFVAHEDADDLTGQGSARLVTYAEFVADSSRLAIYRVKVSVIKRNDIAQKALSLAVRAVPFDIKFSLDTTDALYCTEFVWYSILASTGLDIVPNKSLLMGRQYISVEDLYISSYVSRVTH
jgi:uncharacterized protein YycO